MSFINSLILHHPVSSRRTRNYTHALRGEWAVTISPCKAANVFGFDTTTLGIKHVCKMVKWICLKPCNHKPTESVLWVYRIIESQNGCVGRVF